MEDLVVCELADERARRAPAPDSGNTPSARRHDVNMLWISAFVLIASFLLAVRGNGRVGPIWPDSVVLPESCASRQWFGVSCPGCGLTRSFIHLAHGNYSASLAIHRLGWAMAVMVLGQFPYRAALLTMPAWRARLRRFGGVVGWILLAGLFVNWLLGGVAPAK